MTDQEVFDKVATHLLTQKVKSIATDGLTCAYRGVGGLKCAIGCLIPDEKYYKAIEGTVVCFPWANEPSRPAQVLLDLGISNIDFCTIIQRVHDQHPPENWKKVLKNVAKEWDLNSAVLEEFP